MLVRILGLLSLRFHTIRWCAVECQTGEPLQPFINSRNVLFILLSSGRAARMKLQMMCGSISSVRLPHLTARIHFTMAPWLLGENLGGVCDHAISCSMGPGWGILNIHEYPLHVVTLYSGLSRWTRQAMHTPVLHLISMQLCLQPVWLQDFK